MPRITPAAVIRLIETGFPEIVSGGNIGTLDRGAQQTLAALVALIDGLDDEILAGLSEPRYHDLLVALEYIRATTARWNFPPNPGGPNVLVAPFQPLANRHPVVVIRDVMKECPEEPVAVAVALLSFLNDTDLERSIATDVASAEGAMADGRYKNACVMAGSAIEALLLWAVQKRSGTEHARAFADAQAERQGRGLQRLQDLKADPKRWTLEQYIWVSRHLPVLSAVPADSAILAKDFRNLIHPGRAERLQTHPTRGAAVQALAAVTLCIEDFSARHDRGEL